MKRANGLGTVERLPDGRWRARILVEGKRRTLATCPDEAAALAMLDAWQRARLDGDIAPADTLTLDGFGRDWLDVREVHGSQRREVVRSLRVERSAWACHVTPSELGAMRLQAITARDVEDFARWLRSRPAVHAIHTRDGKRIRQTGRPISRSSQRHVLRLVRQVLGEAVRRELLDRNPAAGVSIAHGSAPARDLSDDWLRQPEIEALLRCEEIDAAKRAAYACAIGLALRLGDLLALRLEHVHLDAQVPGPHVRVWVSKSGRWHRVPVMPWLLPTLRAHVASLPAGSEWLFPAPDGGRYGRHYAFAWAEKRERGRGALPSALARAGVARRVRFHDLRGTTATHLALGTWGRRWSLHEIQAMLAHSDQRVTERYVRRAIDTLAEAAAATPGCPGLPTSGSVPAAKGAESRTSPARIERATYRLEGASSAEGSREVTPSLGERVGNLRAAFVAEVEGGAVRTSLLDAIRALVGEVPVVRAALALEAARGGPHEVLRAADVLDELAAVAAKERAG